MLWKTVGGRCIYRTPNRAQVFDNYFFRWLTFDSDALQTVLNKSNPHCPVLNYIESIIFAVKESPGDCCMLGLGGAGVAHALSPFLGGFTITAIELSEEVIHLAKKFFMTNILKNLEIRQADASLFVKESQQKFHHIIVDLSNATSFPESCYNEQFFIHCKHLLLPGGFLSINIPNRKEQKPIFNMITNQFGKATIILPIKHCANLVVVAINANSVNPLIHLFKQSKNLKKLTWDNTWGCMAEVKSPASA